jgi:hypothetical protein
MKEELETCKGKDAGKIKEEKNKIAWVVKW